jgi:hypothetical protein
LQRNKILGALYKPKQLFSDLFHHAAFRLKRVNWEALAPEPAALPAKPRSLHGRL